MDTIGLGPILARLASALIGLQIALAAQTTTATYPVLPERPTPAQIYAQAPLLERAAACESMGDVNASPRQFNASGTILWGQQLDPVTNEVVIVKRDCGELQINTAVWGRYPQGLDVCGSEADNVYFGWTLYQKYGMAPWSASKSCWAQPGDK